MRLGQLGAVATLPGRHNWQNAAAAYAAAKHAGVQPHAIFASLQSYPGLVHRQETVAYVDGIAYVNDSKATNAAAAARALACYENVYWIAGGRAKPGGLDGIEPALGTVRHAFLMGEAADAFAAALEGDVDTTRCADLAESVARARAMALDEARPGAVVLLSPAGASFDQFADFEARGDAFRVLVEALPGVHRDPFDDEDDAGASPMEAPS